MSATLEVCIDRVEALDACVQGAADGIELCACLDIGGVTPSRGTLRAFRDAPLPVHVLVRPRSGDFLYTEREARAMLDDIAAVVDAGLHGVVIGAATPGGGLDLALMQRLVQAAEGLHTTLHRVVDTLVEPLVAIDQAIALGMDRVLSSGGQVRAIDGASVLAAMHERSRGRVQIVAGGGLDELHIAALRERTGLQAFHGSCRDAVPVDPRLLRLGFSAALSGACSASRVAAFKAALGAPATITAPDSARPDG